MKHKPQSLTSQATAVLLAITAVGWGVSHLSPISVFAMQAADEGAGDQKAAAPNKKAPALQRSKLSAAEVFEKVGEKLNDAQSLSCMLHQNVVMSGQTFHAVGRYVQASGNRIKLEYQIFPVRAAKKADEARLAIGGPPLDTSEQKPTGSLTQVSDGSVLRSYWINGTQKKLSRRNIQEITRAVNDIENYSAAKSLQDLGVGGLQALMSRLQTGMDFGAVQEQQVGDTKLLVLYGRWSEKTLKELFGIEDPKNAVLQEFIPDYVRVYVDSSTMLPRRIQYLKKHPDPERKQVRPVVTLDLRQLKLNEPVDDSTFEFQRPAGDDLKDEDLTNEVIDTIKQIAAAKEQSAAAEAGTEKDDKPEQ